MGIIRIHETYQLPLQQLPHIYILYLIHKIFMPIGNSVVKISTQNLPPFPLLLSFRKKNEYYTVIRSQFVLYHP